MKTDHIPDDWTIETQADGSLRIYDPAGDARCGSYARTTGKPCRRRPLEGRHRCKLHGGASPRGAAHPSTKHGRYSKALPTRLAERYHEALDDDTLDDLRHLLPLYDARARELMGRISDGDYGASYVKLKKLFVRAERAYRTDNDEDFQEAFYGMESLIEEGASDYIVWSEIITVADKQRATVKTITDVETKGEKAISITELMTLVTALVDAFSRANRLDDADTRRKFFAGEIDKLINRIE